jgi:hypothetical protein
MKQEVFLEDGKALHIFYEDVEKMGDVWYPSTIKIQLSQYSVTLKMREILFTGAI